MRKLLTIVVLSAAAAAKGLAADLPDGESVIASARHCHDPLPLPREGAFFGSAIYGGTNDTRKAPRWTRLGHAHNIWETRRPLPSELLTITRDEGLGNCVQFWQRGGQLADLAEQAAREGTWALNIYTDASTQEVERIVKSGRWIGYDTGEIFRWSDADCRGKAKPNLKDVADAFMRRVRDHVETRRGKGWRRILSTGADTSVDYQVAAGVDLPCLEDIAFRNVMRGSGLVRGVARQYGLPLWGTHIAHEWYSFIPYANPLKMPLLQTTFQLKYMTGAKVILNESGDREVQSTLCEDSPMHRMPILEDGRRGMHAVKAADIPAALQEEAERLGRDIDYDSEVCRGYRREIAKFWRFLQANPAPTGQPQAVIAVAKGNFDLAGDLVSEALPVGGAQTVAARDGNWFWGAPERTAEIVNQVLFPTPDDVLKPSKNNLLGGTPYGLVDVASFAYDNITAEYLLRHYKALMFAGWNSCSPKQYGILCDYVKGGGKLLLAMPHLSCDLNRRHSTFARADLVNGGDFTELVGVRVLGTDETRAWWTTALERTGKPNKLGVRWPRRFGPLGCQIGKLAFTGPADRYEHLLVDDEAARPIFFRAKTGKGEVYFLNVWGYPTFANSDYGPGSFYGSEGLIPLIYGYVASLAKGDVYITGKGLEGPSADCRYVACSYFPDDGRIFLKNVDFRTVRTVDLHRFGRVETLTLEPDELRILR